MDLLKLDERIMELIDRREFDAAEVELHQAKLQASIAGDHQALDHVLSLLVTLSTVKEPPALARISSRPVDMHLSLHRIRPSRRITGKVSEVVSGA
jgi:hypothetical protein